MSGAELRAARDGASGPEKLRETCHLAVNKAERRNARLAPNSDCRMRCTAQCSRRCACRNLITNTAEKVSLHSPSCIQAQTASQPANSVSIQTKRPTRTPCPHRLRCSVLFIARADTESLCTVFSRQPLLVPLLRNTFHTLSTSLDRIMSQSSLHPRGLNPILIPRRPLRLAVAARGRQYAGS